MIISNNHKFIFIHVHKCAGSTIAHLLKPYTQWNDIELGVTTYGENIQAAYRERFGIWKHARAIEVRQVIGDDLFSSYFKFAFVRNPLYRVISFYTFFQRLLKDCHRDMLATINSWPISKAMAETGSFPEFIRHTGFQEPPMFRLLTEAPLRPTRLLVDYIGKVENFARDIAYVFERIGLPVPKRVEKKNVSQNETQKLADYYSSEEDLSYVYEKYKRDFDLFGYSLEEGIELFRSGI